MFTEFNRIFSLEVDLKNLEVTYNSKALYTNVDLNTSTMMIKMSLDQNALDLTGKTVNAFIKTGIDKNITMQRCEILEATEGIIGLDFKSSALKAGTNTFFLEIKSENEEIINSPLITYKVVELFDTYSSIEGDNNVSILTELITEVDIAKGSVEVLKNEIAEQERQREEAEASRKNNESSRIQAETNRTNSESTRVTNENNRNQAESTRESNETKRVNAENLRESAENTRKQEETKRSQNESLRVESEKERILSYEEIKNNNAIFKEQMNADFGNAKTDYFGEEHPNVVERLNSDFDNLHQRMNDSSYLEYEGINITANNSYYGLTKDTVVKGRTLQNLNSLFKNTFAVNKTLSAWFDQYRLCEASMLKEGTTYTIAYDLDILEDASNGAYNYAEFVFSDDIITSASSIKGFSIKEGKVVYTFTYKLNSSNTQKYFAVRPIRRNTTPVAEEYVRYTVQNIILVEGDYSNRIEELPYGEGIYSVGENEVTEDGKYKISGKSCGKNLVTGLTKTNPNNLKIDLARPIKNGESFQFGFVPEGLTFTHFSVYCENSKTGVSDYHLVDANGLSRILTARNDYDYIKIYCTHNPEPENLKDLMVAITPTLLPYEPYQESTYSYILNEPLRSLPNGVCDTIEGDNVIRRVGKVVLDGSETYTCDKKPYTYQ